jgi:hypothetical protein
MRITKDAEFRQGAVGDSVRGLVRVQEAKWAVSGLVDVLVVENVMTVAGE